MTVNAMGKSLEEFQAVSSVTLMAQEDHVASGISMKRSYQQFVKSISTNQQMVWTLLEYSVE